MDARLPVIVGVGQVTDQSEELARKREPLALVEQAARLAFADAQCAGLPSRVDSVRVVNMLSGAAYHDPPQRLAERLGLPAGERRYTAIGGNGPQWLINSAADDIAAGRCRIALIAGGEALHALRLAARQGVELEWTRGSGRAETVGDDRQGSHQDEWSYGLQMPTQIYPLFEVALRAREHRPPAEHQAHLARLCASLAAVAATHPNAWFRDGKSAAQIGTLSSVNRMVAYPYPKYMTSILDVDQAAAVVVTSVAEARALAIPESRWVYVHGAGEANDIWYLKDRVDYWSSPGMAEAYRQALEQAAIPPSSLDHVDLYSCFPVAVQMGARLLGFPTDGTRPLTVTGGLPYFGGAGNNYALHAVATMVDRLRKRPGALGMVSALGWYLTKHAVGVYGSAPPTRPWARSSPKERQPAIDALPHPEFVNAATGGGAVETYTVLHDRDGAPREGVVVVRCDDGRRTLALMESSQDVFDLFETEEMVGASGTLFERADGRVELRLRGG